MDNCVLSKNNQLVIFKNKRLLCGITTTKFGNCQIGAGHNAKIKELMEMTKTDNCLYLVPSHGNRILAAFRVCGIETIKYHDGIIYSHNMLDIYNSNILEFIGCIHCGWRSVVSGILEKALDDALILCKDGIKNIKAIIYNGICQNCYKVRDDVYNKFGKGYKKYFTHNQKDKYQLNLSGIIRQKLIDNGLENKRITTVNLCSHHHRFKDLNLRLAWDDQPLLFSHRHNELERNLIFVKPKSDNTLIAGTTGNCPYVILYNA